MQLRISAVSCNHNTSAYMELMLRSFDALHDAGYISDWCLFDNASDDERTALLEYAIARGTPIEQSGFPLDTQQNSHGKLLARVVERFPQSDYYVLLDADVVCTQRQTIPRLITELEADPRAWAIGVAPSWDGTVEIPTAVRSGNPDICDARLHPACAVIKNTPLFRRVLEYIGFGTYIRHHPDTAEYLDTCKLLTTVMRTHSLHHIVSRDILVRHFFSTSYTWDDEPTRLAKQATRDRLLSTYRLDTR